MSYPNIQERNVTQGHYEKSEEQNLLSSPQFTTFSSCLFICQSWFFMTNLKIQIAQFILVFISKDTVSQETLIKVHLCFLPVDLSFVIGMLAMMKLHDEWENDFFLFYSFWHLALGWASLCFGYRIEENRFQCGFALSSRVYFSPSNFLFLLAHNFLLLCITLCLYDGTYHLMFQIFI